MEKKAVLLLIVVDDQLRSLVSMRLGRRGHIVVCTSALEAGVDLARRRRYNVVMAELSLAQAYGRPMLERLQKAASKAPLLLLGSGTAAFPASGRYYGFQVLRADGASGALNLQTAVETAIADRPPA
ncbi:MAG: hypothetical protein V3S11_02140 [Elusimicrobiota bacterium]